MCVQIKKCMNLTSSVRLGKLVEKGHIKEFSIDVKRLPNFFDHLALPIEPGSE